MSRWTLLAFLAVAAGCPRSSSSPPGDESHAEGEAASEPEPSDAGRPERPGRPSPVAPVGDGSTEPLESRTYAVLLLDDERLLRGGSLGVTVESVRDPARPEVTGQLVLPGSVSGLAALAPGRIAACCGGEGVFVVDLLGAEGPRQVGHLDTAGAAWRAEPFGEHLLLAEGHRGVSLLDLRRPAQPRQLTRWRSEGYVRHVLPVGEGAAARAYVAEGRAGLAILDLSSPTRPQLLSRLDTEGEARAVAVRDEVAFVADFHEGVVAVDVSDPRRPRALGRLETPDSARDVLATGSVLYVAVGTEGLLVVDAASPSAMRQLSRLETSAPAVRLALDAGRLYVAVDSHGVAVYDIAAPTRPRRLEAEPEGEGERGDGGHPDAAASG